MPRISRAERHSRVHARSIAEFRRVSEATWYERRQALEDRRFCYLPGSQWEGFWQQQFENRPRLEFNKTSRAVARIIDEYRRNRIAVRFIPKDGRDADELAETCAGLHRADSQDSNADEARDNAFDEALTGGYGAYRLRAVEVDEDDDTNEQQRITIEPIFDAESCVYFGQEAQRGDKRDALRCWVLTPMTRQAFEDEWKEDPTTWPKDVSTEYFNWYDGTADIVWIAEFYEVERKKEVVIVFESITGEREEYTEAELDDEEGELRAELEAQGLTEVERRDVKRRRVHKWLMSGAGILEDCGYVPGQWIPIVPVYAQRRVIDGVERVQGHVRHAKDAQRLYNVQLSRLVEIASLSAVEVPIVTPEQIAGHENAWTRANIDNPAYLQLNPIETPTGDQPAGPIGMRPVPQVPPALGAVIQTTSTDLKEILGNQEQGEQLKANTSAEALSLQQQRLDMVTSLYVSQMAKAIRVEGDIWLSMANDIYVEVSRRMKTISPEGKFGSVEINKPKVRTSDHEDAGETYFENDMAGARFDVAVEIGPSTISRKQTIVRAVASMLPFVPEADAQTRTILLSFAIENLDVEGMGPMRDWFHKQLVKIGVEKPTDEEAAELQQQMAAEAQKGPDPQAQALQGVAQKEQALAAKAQADTILSLAKVKETEANTALKRAQAGNETVRTISDVAQRERDDAFRQKEHDAAQTRDVRNFAERRIDDQANRREREADRTRPKE